MRGEGTMGRTCARMQMEACPRRLGEGRVVDGRMLILDWRSGEERVRRTCTRVCEGTVCGKGRQRSGPVAVEDGRTETILYRDRHFHGERKVDAF